MKKMEKKKGKSCVDVLLFFYLIKIVLNLKQSNLGKCISHVTFLQSQTCQGNELNLFLCMAKILLAFNTYDGEEWRCVITLTVCWC